MEIERKFLVDYNKLKLSEESEHELIKQIYFSFDNNHSARIRSVDNKKGFITFKFSTNDPKVRQEYEIEINYDLAEKLQKEFSKIIKKPLIEKTRYKYNHNGIQWDIDMFIYPNNGIVLAEKEFHENENPDDLEMPEWIIKEVTNDPQYLNSNLNINLKSTYKRKDDYEWWFNQPHLPEDINLVEEIDAYDV
jgi:CYTH domain-containing protein